MSSPKNPSLRKTVVGIILFIEALIFGLALALEFVIGELPSLLAAGVAVASAVNVVMLAIWFVRPTLLGYEDSRSE